MDLTIGLTYTIFILIILIALTMKWVKFGIMFLINKLRYKENLGLIYFRGLGNNYGLPKFIDLGKVQFETGNEVRVLTRDSFNGFRMFGCPCIFVDAEDASVTTGFYLPLFNLFSKEKINDVQKQEKMLENVTAARIYQTLQVEGKVQWDKDKKEFEVLPATHMLRIGNEVIETNIPKLLPEKPSIRISASTIKQAIIHSGFSKVLDLFNKNTGMIMILAGGAIIVGLVAAYFGFANTTTLADLGTQLASVKSMLAMQQANLTATNISGV